MARATRLLVTLVIGVASAAAVQAAVPLPPDQVAYSGVLVDGGGVPLPGPVDLTARIYDAASAGTLVYKQSFTGVALSDGHFTLSLGPTGAATDSPADPLTTSLRTALTGDLAAAAGRFVEISVNTDPPLARVQLVLVPYAMRADHATTSDVATNALDTQAVGGLDGGVLTELFEHYNEDGGPPASDPAEGTGDPDGDGEMNFVDPDNDNDALSDAAEVSQGSNINLVTPRIASVSPSSGGDTAPVPVTVTGTGLLPGLTAAFGAQVFSPAATPTSFQVTLQPPAFGGTPVLDLLVTNPNAESDLEIGAFTFVPGAGDPVPIGFFLSTTKPTIIVARGEELLVAGGPSANANRYAVDTVADGVVAFGPVQTLSGLSPAALSWNASKVVHGLRGFASTDQIQLLRDNNGDTRLTSGEEVVLESPGADPKPLSASLVFDAADRAGGGYVRSVGGAFTAMAFHDRDGNGAFTGPNELVTIEAAGGADNALGEAAFDASGRLAYVYWDSGNALLRVAWDRSGDGDYADTVAGNPELSTIATATPGCVGMAFDTAGRLAVVNGNTVFRDLSGDGDFADTGETLSLAACDVTAASGGDRIVLATNGANVLVDFNDDGDFLDPSENTDLGTAPAPIAVTKTASGRVMLLSAPGVLVGPLR